MTGPDFGFLGQRAGFQVAESLLAVTPDDSYLRLLLAGVVNTLTVAALAIPLASAGGLALGLARLTRHPLLHRALAAVVAPVRNTPVLLQLFLWYALLLQLPDVRAAWHPLPGVYLSNRGLALPGLEWPDGAGWPVLDVPGMTGLGGLGLAGGWALSPEFTALVLGLAVFHAAYVADIVRGAVMAVPLGQVDAGRALGLRPATLAAQVVYPFAARVALPPYANQCLMLLKNSTLAIAIGYQDLMGIVNTTITQTGRAVEGITLAAGFYLAVSLLLAAALARHNARVNRHGIEGTGPARLGQRLGTPAWSRAALWHTPGQAALTLGLALLAALAAWQALHWATWGSVTHGPAAACADAAGACWAAVWENRQLLLFGTLAPEARGAAALACALLAGCAAVLIAPPLPGLPARVAMHARWRVGIATALALGAAATLRGLPPVQWGGLLVTLALALAAIALSLPGAVLLALMRRSARRRWRWPATALIETARAVPLVTQLLLVAFWVPLLAGGDWSGAKFQLALAALALHTACLLAEVLRGALQAVPQSQVIGAQALGMRPATVLASVVLPQARRLAAPAALGVFVGAVKDTSLVMVIGLFDVLSAAKAVVADTDWRPYDLEVYGAVALFYLAIGLPLAHLARRLERLGPAR